MNFMLLAFSAISHGTQAPSTSGSDPGLQDLIVIMMVRRGDMIILDIPGSEDRRPRGRGLGAGAMVLCFLKALFPVNLSLSPGNPKHPETSRIVGSRGIFCFL